MWEKLWSKAAGERKIAFHEQKPHDWLVKYHRLFTSVTDRPKIFIPLCGKSVDIRFLLDENQEFFKQSEVLGVEYVETAVQELAEEEEFIWEPTKRDAEMSGFTIYTSKNSLWSRLQIYSGDFFKFSQYQGPKFDLCYDRASLLAIEPKMRRQYADILHRFCKNILLIVFEYVQEERGNRPPYSVEEPVVNQLFGEKFSIQRLETRDKLDNGEWHGTPMSKMNEVVYRLSLK